MAKIASEKQFLPFIKGLITEASPLTYPEGATLDEDNFVLNRDGSRQRRLGLEKDSDATWVPVSTDYALTSYHEWPQAGGSNITIGVVRVDSTLYFLDMTVDSPTLSILNGGNPVVVPEIGTEKIDVTNINNSLVIVSRSLNYPLLFEYNYSDDTISYSTIEIKVRDFWGIDDGLKVNERPLEITKEHRYNLRNQGWIPTIKTATGCNGAGPIDCTKAILGVYPSNSDIWTLGKYPTAIDSVNFETYWPETLDKNSQNWMQAPKGKYLLDIYNRGSSRQEESGLLDLPQDSETGRISTVASFAGRVFYSGIKSQVLGKDSKSPNYSGYIFFTQTITTNDKLNSCYSEADPTSDVPDIIDTDGGTIHIPEAIGIIKIIGIRSSLIVFAENGIWEVFAGDTGFKATEYQLNKISNIGVINKDTIVEANDTVVFWSKFGIYVLVPNQITGRFEAQNISLPTIQTFYLDISDNAKKNAKGFFEEEQGRVRWLYSDNVDVDYPNKYNRELILDQSLQAFYPHSFSTTDYWISDYLKIPNFVLNTNQDIVYVDTDIVYVGTEEVTSENITEISRTTKFNFLTISPTNGFSISGYTSRTFLDWGTDNYSSYMITGYELFGDFMRRKQVPYIMFHFKKTEDGFDVDSNLENESSCYVQAQWSWTNSANAGKWGTPFQAYRFTRNYITSGSSDTFDTGERLVTTKNKLRGSGKSLSLKIYSEQGKDMHIYGWGLNMMGNSRV